jgi:hypothetical protein
VRATEVVPLWSVAGWRAHRERARELSTKTGEQAKALAGAVVRQAHHERMRGAPPRTDEGGLTTSGLESSPRTDERGLHHERMRGLTTSGLESSARKQVSGRKLSLGRWFDRLTTNG